MKPQISVQNNSQPTRPFFTSFCIGLASSLLAASLLVAPCGVTNAQATTMKDLELEGDIQFNKKEGTIDEATTLTTSPTDSIGMGAHLETSEHEGISLTNQGKIILTGPSAPHSIIGMCAIHPKGANNYTVSVINDGTIKITSATTGQEVDGINAQNDYARGNIKVMNHGTIEVEGVHQTTGIEASFTCSDGYFDIENTGSIKVTSTQSPQVFGVHTANAACSTQNSYTNSFNNSGSISVENGGNAAYGFYADIQKNHTINIINSGKIKTLSLNNAAYAIHVRFNNQNIAKPSVLINNNYIEATNTGQNSTEAYGIFIDKARSTTIFNESTGTIKATSDNGIASGIYLPTPMYTAINNTGTINATSSNNAAYGIQILNSGSGVIVNNTGTINTKGATASHELFINNGKAIIGAWTITLRDYNESDNTSDPFAVQGMLEFHKDRIPNDTVPGTWLPPTTFIVTPGTAAEGFAFNKEFPIQDMIHNYGGGNIVGAVGIAESALPFLKAELLHGDIVGSAFEDLADGADDSKTEQTIIIRAAVDPETSPGHEAEEQIVTGLTQNMNMLCSILDTHLDYDELPEDWRAFAIPYYTHGVNYDYGYNTDVMGIALGATHRVNDNFSAGAHLNFATIDSESDATENDAIMAGLGVHAKYHFTDDFHIRGQITGFVMENRLALSMNAKPEKVMSDADTTSLGMYAAMFAAYDYKANEYHTFTPELALKYVYAQHDGYSTNWRKANGMPVDYDISYGDTSFSELYTEASLRWKGNFDLGTMESGEHRGVLHPTMRAGVRQALMGAEVESKLDYNDFDFGTTTSHANETSVLFEGGLEWVMGDTTTSLTYIGDFGHKEESHMGLLKIEFEF